MADRVLGLIAGRGRLPVLVAEGMKASGVRVCGVGLRGHYEPVLADLCDDFEVAGMLSLGRWVRILRRHGVREAVLVGRVAKASMHDPLRLIRQMPDLSAAILWYRRLRSDRRNAAVLAAVADELGRHGITLADSTTYITDHLAGGGVLTRTQPTREHEADIDRLWSVLARIATLGVGQSIAVCGGRVIAVESVEGTDAMIHRAGRLAGSWTLLKGPSDDHDMRFDVPTVGPATIEAMAAARAGCLAVRAGRVIMIDKGQVIQAADCAGIAVVGVEESAQGGAQES